jgi:hypothetical protein
VHACLLGERTALVGDPIYGQPDPAGMMLHARTLGFAEPQTGERVEVVAPLPPRFRLAGLTMTGQTAGALATEALATEALAIGSLAKDSLAIEARASGDTPPE